MSHLDSLTNEGYHFKVRENEEHGKNEENAIDSKLSSEGVPLLAFRTSDSFSSSPYFHLSDMEHLPGALLLIVFEFLLATHVAASCARVCKRFNSIEESNILWIKFKKRDFGASVSSPAQSPTRDSSSLAILTPKDEYEDLYLGRVKLRDRRLQGREFRHVLMACYLIQVLICFSVPLFVMASFLLMLEVPYRFQYSRASILLSLSPILFSLNCILGFYIWASVVWIRGKCCFYFHWRMNRIMRLPLVLIPSMFMCVSQTGPPKRCSTGMLVFLFILGSFSLFIVLLILRFSGTTHAIPYRFIPIPAFLGVGSILLLRFTSCVSVLRGALFGNSLISYFNLVVLILLPPLISLELMMLKFDGMDQKIYIAMLPVLLQLPILLVAICLSCQRFRVFFIPIFFLAWASSIVLICIKGDGIPLVSHKDAIIMTFPLLIVNFVSCIFSIFLLGFSLKQFKRQQQRLRRRDLEEPVHILPDEVRSQNLIQSFL